MAKIKINSLDIQVGKETVVSSAIFSLDDNQVSTLTGDEKSGIFEVSQCITGYLPHSAGTILAGEDEIQGLAPSKRKVVRISKDWALFPHLTVKQNLEMGLTLKKMKSDEIQEISKQYLSNLQLTEKSAMFPDVLSIENQFKLALARAAIIEPNLIILEEALGPYDFQTRQKLVKIASEVKKQFSLTLLFVTKFPIDVLGISDRLIVMHKGFIEQSGDAQDVYEAPATPIVAKATGEINSINAQVMMSGDFTMFSTKLGGFNLKSPNKLRMESQVELLIRPEQTKIVALGNTADARNIFSAKIKSIQYMAGFQYVHLETDDTKPFISIQNQDNSFKVDDDIDVILMRDEYPIIKK
ncbi:MAG: ABC transporter ATP-binding protein [Candidatus Cloacimonetes bacterium]|nr:ABC transporter ATP-binding protein [Candidatus Cloacimonadota bacterium]